MKASELGLNSIIYVINKGNGKSGTFKPIKLEIRGDNVEITSENYDSLIVQKDYNFHESEATGFTFYFAEKSYLNALLPIQEKRVDNLRTELSQASGWLEEIRKKINTIENGI